MKLKETKFTNNVFFTMYLLAKETFSRYFNSKSIVTPPQRIDDYELVGLLHSPEFHESHKIYTYQNPNKEKVVVKVWKNSLRNYDYYSLEKEAVYINLLEEMIKNSSQFFSNDKRLFKPLELVDTKENDEYFALITKYIDGVELRTKGVTEQIRIYLDSINFLYSLEKRLIAEDRKKIKNKTILSIFVSYFFILGLSLIQNIKHSKQIILSTRFFIRSLPALIIKRKDRSIAHQDLHTKNILVNIDSVTIIDPGNLMVGHRHNDLAITLVHEWQNKEFRDLLISSINDEIIKDDNDRKVFFGLLVYHTTHLLSMQAMKKNSKYYLEILRYVDKNYKRTYILNILRKIRSYFTKVFWPKSGYSLFPISSKFGYDRGTPIDRYYINKFLQDNKMYISGRCLEIGNNDYTVKYGETRVSRSDVLDIDVNNKSANIHGDLRNLDKIADNTYDTIILTHTLGVIDDFNSAIKECYRILKPSGKILVTVSAMGVAQDIKQSYWRFTETSLGYSFSKFFRDIKVFSYGNVLSGQAFWVGVSAEELTPNELEENDKRYAVIVGLTAEK